MDLDGSEDFHDAQLHEVAVDWQAATVAVDLTLDLRAAARLPLAGAAATPPDLPDAKRFRITAHDFTDVRVPRREPWGPSTWVMHLNQRSIAAGSTLVIEMQSGDLIEVSCRSVDIDEL